MTLPRSLHGACLVTVVCLVASSAAGAATIHTITYSDKPAGFEITLPTDWYYVPSTVTKVEAIIAKLTREKQTQLASIYKSAIKTAAGRSALAEFSFDAFLYPPVGSMETEILIGIVRTPTAYTRATLKSVGETFAKTFSSSPGAKIAKPTVVSLPVGPAAYLEGTDPSGPGGASGGFELYLVPHGKLLYELSIHTEATLLPKETVFTKAVRSLAFI